MKFTFICAYGKTEQYSVTITNNFAALEILEDNGDIRIACVTIRGNIKISTKEGLGCCELKPHKPWFHEECSELVD
jgi:hypothetical protein